MGIDNFSFMEKTVYNLTKELTDEMMLGRMGNEGKMWEWEYWNKEYSNDGKMLSEQKYKLTPFIIFFNMPHRIIHSPLHRPLL